MVRQCSSRMANLWAFKNREVKRSMRKSVLIAVVAALIVASVSLLVANAASHREAPAIAMDPEADITDFFMFRSYEPDKDDKVILIMDAVPGGEPSSAPTTSNLIRTSATPSTSTTTRTVKRRTSPSSSSSPTRSAGWSTNPTCSSATSAVSLSQPSPPWMGLARKVWVAARSTA